MSSLKIHGPIRIRSMQTGITKWKEGSFEIVEKENKVSLVVHYNTGGIPRIFQLSHNIKNVVLRPSGAKQSRLMLTLQDNSFLSIDKVPSKDAEEMRLFLDAVHQNRLHTAMKPQGSGSFGAILGSRTSQKETNRQLSYSDNQTPSKRGSLEMKDDIPFRKVLGNPGRGSIKTAAGSGIPVTRTVPSLTSTSTPLRSGLLENRTEKRKRMLSSGSELNEDYPKENDSSSNNKAMTDPSRKYLSSSREKQLSLKQSEENRTSGLLPLQSSSFYGSRTGSKDYSSGSTNLDRFTEHKYIRQLLSACQ
uniref:ubiquitinyl hydrolase 1 n=1 Tax=Suricata suricatta TaxID=37032 RepID=A0A673TCT4_SURSU